jgi:hypothetical protein
MGNPEPNPFFFGKQIKIPKEKGIGAETQWKLF